MLADRWCDISPNASDSLADRWRDINLIKFVSINYRPLGRKEVYTDNNMTITEDGSTLLDDCPSVLIS